MYLFPLTVFELLLSVVLVGLVCGVVLLAAWDCFFVLPWCYFFCFFVDCFFYQNLYFSVLFLFSLKIYFHRVDGKHLRCLFFVLVL